MTNELKKLKWHQKVIAVAVGTGVLAAIFYGVYNGQKQAEERKYRAEVRTEFEGKILQEAYGKIGVNYIPRTEEDTRIAPSEEEVSKMRGALSELEK